MRRRNGYRGLHELASWTRVVRAEDAATGDRFASVPITVPEQFEASSFGSFQVAGRLSDRGSVRVYAATDAALARPVWILERDPTAISITPQRVAVSRPTRLFWLDGGQKDGQRWDAFEAVHGSPLAELLELSGKLSWQQVRGLLLELTDELSASLSDGTLPAGLDPSHVWLDRTGRIKLLDICVGPNSDERNELSAMEQTPALFVSEDLGQDQAADKPEARAMLVVRSLLDVCSRRQLLPGHAMDFMAQLAERPDDRETLHWANEELRRMLERPSTLGWDDRLGVLAVSFCTEMPIYSTFTLALSVLVFILTAFGGSWTSPIVTVTILCLAVPLLLGYALHGGPVFHLTGIQVRQAGGRRASRLRCGCRALAAWLPTIVGHLALGSMLAGLSQSGGAESMDPMESLRTASLLFVWMGGSLAQGVGALYAVVRPRRGIQDWITATRLVPS